VSDARTRQIIEFASAGAAIGRGLIAPPGVPAANIAALRKAFDAMTADKEFLADAAKRRLVIDPTNGAEVQNIAARIIGSDKSLIEAASAAMK